MLDTRINTNLANSQQSSPSVTVLINGGFVVTWESFQDRSVVDIYGQRYDVSGNRQGVEFRINSYTQSDQQNPSVTALTDGGFVVTWESFQDGSGFGIYGQRYNASGIMQGTEFPINSYTQDYQITPSVIGLTNGGFVVVWQSFGQDGYGEGIYGQRYDINGSKQGVEFRINSFTQNSQFTPSAAALTDGGFLVTWTSSLPGFDIFGQRYDANGNTQGTEFLVNSSRIDNQSDSSVTALTSGGFVVVWMSGNNARSIYGQRYDAGGNAQGTEFLIGTFVLHDQFPSVTALTDGGFVVTWQSADQVGFNFESNINAQRYDADGNAQGTEFLVNSSAGHSIRPSVTGLIDGGFVVTWQSIDQDGVGLGIYGKRYDASGNEVEWIGAGKSANEIFKADGLTGGDELDNRDIGALEAGKIKVMADFSKAAYSLQSWENTSINNEKLFADNTVSSLVSVNGQGWTPLYLNPVFTSSTSIIDGHSITNTMADGFYTNGNAAAFVALSADAIVISFRGTNDNENYPRASPDQEDWLNMSRHYDLMRPLVDALDNYIENNGIHQVYVTGHSLGGAMAIKFMDDHINGYKGANYEAITFATPSYDFLPTYDDRMTLIEIEGDPVPNFGLNNGRNIHFFGNKTTGSSTAYHSMDYYRQMVDSVDNTAWDQILKESGDQYVYIGGEMPDADHFIVDGRLSGENSVVNQGNNVLTDPYLSDWGVYYGGRGADTLTGGGDNELMLGGSGNDVLKGGWGGKDRLFGGVGNDTLYGSNGLAELVFDELYGGLDDDTYIINHLGEVITENLNEGTDKINSSVTYTLPANIEKLTLTGTSTINGTGNDLDNVITGNSSVNQLIGWSGADTMIGGLGNDSYFVENVGDIVTERLNAGTDDVSSRLTYTLPANVENLTLTSASAVDGTGNGLANVIIGNLSVNQLKGGAGDDTLDGGSGNNVLTGGTGKDIFKFTKRGHIDTITDYNVVNDTIQLENAVFTALTATGAVTTGQFRIGTQALDTDDFIIYNSATGSLLYDANGSGAGAAVQIATIGIGLALTNVDIVVI